MSDITEKRKAQFYDISEIVMIPQNNNGYVNIKSLVKVWENALILATYIQNNNIQITSTSLYNPTVIPSKTIYPMIFIINK